MDPDILIDQPRLRTPAQRTRDTLLTFIMWGIYLYLWLPLVSLGAWLLGFRLFYDEMITRGGYGGLQQVLGWYGIIIALILATVLVWSLVNRRRFRGKERRCCLEVVPGRATAKFFGVSDRDLVRLKTARRAVLGWDEQGRLTDLQTKR